ncbi:Mitogen-activated protein kinase kinase kinase 3 [Platanthera guangdongensis]|uniref:Mitogen-activated protein kinase kinase kinase 3 n=1 Tax=Platanthera guangdongensis TaxID=2320717 RepID=A0ABR2MHM7_9ASPA
MRKSGSASSKKVNSVPPLRTFSVSPADYELLEEVGNGASATVYRAIYKPANEIVAVKCLDLDRSNSNLDDIRREAQTMSLIDHPNLIKAFCSFVVEHCLWVVMPFMAEGSCLHLMKIAYPDGFEEPVIGSILKETLKALDYLHNHGHIHRDVKAGNILLDNSASVKLGDYGVTACMFDKGDRQSSRNTFVGTPCWMAPEVLQPGGGYDFKADIWSFGITALELAHGHAPFSKYPPMKVLLMTLQNAPPGLDYDRDKRFSKSFKEMVAMCLVKDQTKRPTAKKLLKHTFFKNAKPPELSLKSLLLGLPPLWDRVKALQLKDAAQLALKKMPSAEQEALSQSEYQRGVSAWNFDIEDLKAQASLIQDDEDFSGKKEGDVSLRDFMNNQDRSTFGSAMEKPLVANETDFRINISAAESSETGGAIKKEEHLQKDLSDFGNREDIDRSDKVRLKNDSVPSTSKQDVEPRWKSHFGKSHQTYSGPILPSTVHNNSSERGRTTERFEGDNLLATERVRRDSRKVPNLSGPLMLPNRASANSLSAPVRTSSGYGDTLEDKTRASVVQIKGRFSVTSENIELLKGSLMKSASVGEWLVNSKQVLPKDNVNTLPASVLMPHLQNLFQQTSFQQDLLSNLLNNIQQNDIVDGIQTTLPLQTHSPEDEITVDTTVTERERLLLAKISELQAICSNSYALFVPEKEIEKKNYASSDFPVQ